MSLRLPRIMVFGTFDLLHPGHLFLLREAEKRGEVTVIVARDKNVEKIKKMKPVEKEEVRAEAIKKNFPSMHVKLGNENDFLVPVQDVMPDLILLGYDQRLPGGLTEKDLGCAVTRLPAFRPDLHKSSMKRKQL